MLTFNFLFLLMLFGRGESLCSCLKNGKAIKCSESFTESEIVGASCSQSAQKLFLMSSINQYVPPENILEFIPTLRVIRCYYSRACTRSEIWCSQGIKVSGCGPCNSGGGGGGNSGAHSGECEDDDGGGFGKSLRDGIAALGTVVGAGVVSGASWGFYKVYKKFKVAHPEFPSFVTSTPLLDEHV